MQDIIDPGSEPVTNRFVLWQS